MTHHAVERPPLVHALLQRRLVTERDIAALERWVPYKGLRLTERLFRSGLLTDEQLCEVFLSLGASDGTAELAAGLPPPVALGAFPRAVAERHRAVPLRVARSRLITAMLDPSDTDAIERLSFASGLAIEPRAARARVLFMALSRAYGLPLVSPDGAFVASRELPTIGDGAMGGPGLPEPMSGPVRAAPTLGSLLDPRPARSPALAPADIDDDALPLASPLEARDSLPPQVLRLLVPPLRSAVLFLVRDTVAVGWDGRAPLNDRDDLRDVLLPLTATSVFSRALHARLLVVGDPAEASTVERILWRHMNLAPPSSFAVLPIVVGRVTHALLYVDRSAGDLDDGLVHTARSAGNALADGLAPFVATGTLFPSVTPEALVPIRSA